MGLKKYSCQLSSSVNLALDCPLLNFPNEFIALTNWRTGTNYQISKRVSNFVPLNTIGINPLWLKGSFTVTLVTNNSLTQSEAINS